MRRSGRIALYGGGGAPYHHAAVFARAGHETEFVFPVDILAGVLVGFDAFVMPGGGYRAMQGQIDPLGSAGARAIRDYVSAGGMYIGSCAGSYCAAAAPQSFVQACPTQKDLSLIDAGIWNDGGEEWVGLQSPGVGVIRSRNVSPEHPIMRGMPEYFEIAHYNGPLFRGGEALATVDGATEHFTPAEQFLSARTGPTLIEEAAREHIPNIVVGSLGRGRVVLFGSHPEFGFTLAMDDEQMPGSMLHNAIDWQLEQTGPDERPVVPVYSHSHAHTDPTAAQQVQLMARLVRDRAETLRRKDDEPQWLQSAYAMSTFGLTPAVIWDVALSEICRLADEVETRAVDVDPAVLSFRPPASWNLDGGYWGVLPLLEQTQEMLDQALHGWHLDLGAPSKEPYAFALTSPYHLVAGSYLAALGRVTAAALLCAANDWAATPASKDVA